jgi:hypothetical protein
VKPVKVFCIGFHKTGTKSLKLALQELGYTVAGPNFVKDPDIRRENLTEKALAIAYQFDAFQDDPWPLVYKEMDKLFPGSKFIITVREPVSWLRSARSYFGQKQNPIRRMMYGNGSFLGSDAIYLRRYTQHYEEVQRYFASRPGDLLVFDLVANPNWELLCKFLGYDVPPTPFPRENAQNYDAKKPRPPLTIFGHPLRTILDPRKWFSLSQRWLSRFGFPMTPSN